MSQRVLFISYTFPPVGGAGVQRAVKFVKYLPHFGWEPTVLTVANPSVPVLDESLAADVPEGTVVRRARTLEPGYAVKSAVTGSGHGGRHRGSLKASARSLALRAAKLALQPDPQILWAPAAVREGMRALRESPHAAIVATGPPFSAFLVGARLARRSGLPLVLDYRDEWDISADHWENKRPGPLSRYVQNRMQAAVVRAAGALVATTESSRDALDAVRRRAGSDARVSWIYNGYDPEDFPPGPTPAREAREVYRLAYVGTLWNLTSVAPLVDAALELARRDPGLASGLELAFAGRRTEAQAAHLGRLAGSPCRVAERPYLGHREAVDLMRDADGLCVLLSDVPGAGRVVPAKLFEYMAARRPILVVAPRGEVWRILDGHPAAFLHEPGDIVGIADRLAREVRRRRDGGPDGVGSWDGSGYDRKSQAARLAATLDALQPRGAAPTPPPAPGALSR